MFCNILSSALSGVDAIPIWVEADVSDGLPAFSMVGYISSQVREAQDRVRTSLKNLGIRLPPKRITINLSPGDHRKEGTRFDLPIAAAILLAIEKLPLEPFKNTMLLGELHLDGRISAVKGVLPSVLKAREIGCSTCLLPRENYAEGSIVSGMRIVGIDSLADLFSYVQGTLNSPPETTELHPASYSVDFNEIRGQQVVKRAAQIAAAGFHNLLLSGPPGSGKSMTARRIPTILPPLSHEESLELTRIYSVMGLLPENTPLLSTRPFRSPHHTLSPAALCGGGIVPRPGEVTLSHRGVLFLDEFPEVSPRTLEMLRQPLEDHEIYLSRASASYRFPANFLLIAAMNPCPCGYYPDPDRCSCTPKDILHYRRRISQPILDRIDLRVEVPAASFEDLKSQSPDPQSSEFLREQVDLAVSIQKERYASLPIVFNSELTTANLEKYCCMTNDAAKLLEKAFRTLGLSARSYHRIRKVSRTIADLEGSDLITEAHISEALCFRSDDLQTTSFY